MLLTLPLSHSAPNTQVSLWFLEHWAGSCLSLFALASPASIALLPALCLDHCLTSKSLFRYFLSWRLVLIACFLQWPRLLLDPRCYIPSLLHFLLHSTYHLLGFPGALDGKESACNAGDPGSIPGLGRSPGERNSNPLQYSCLGNPMNRGAWQATVHGATKNQTWLRDWAHTHTHTHTQCSERFKIAHVHMVNTSKSGLEPLTIVPKSLYKPSAATESGLRPGDHSFN